MRVALGGADVGVTKDFLHGPDVDALLETGNQQCSNRSNATG
jgi:hypothetical protein